MPDNQAPPLVDTKKEPREQTKSQTGIGAGMVSTLSGLLRFRDSEFYVGQCDYQTYRRMMRHPTLRLAHAFATAPIISAGWSVKNDDDAPEEAVDLIKDIFDPMRQHILSQACRSIYYGHQAFEKVWAIEKGRYVIKRLKPLLPDLTEVVVDQYGNRIGLKNREVVLTQGHFLQVSHDVEADYWYGRSRLENVREFVWGQWCSTQKKLEAHQSKAAGVIPIVVYPEGRGTDENGAVVENWKRAKLVLDSLGIAAGVTMPNTLAPWAEDAIRGGLDIKELMAWKVQFLEAATGHGAEFVSVLNYDDKLLVRGYLVPERAIMEGQFGTKAEASTHGDIGVSVSDQALKDIVAQVNDQCVNDVLRTNFGEDVVGKVYLEAAPIVDEAKELIREIVKATYTGAPDLARVDLSFDDMNDMLGLPKSQENIDDEPDDNKDDNDATGSDSREGRDANAPDADAPGAPADDEGKKKNAQQKIAASMGALMGAGKKRPKAGLKKKR